MSSEVLSYYKHTGMFYFTIKNILINFLTEYNLNLN